MNKLTLTAAAFALAGSMMAQDSGFSAGLDLAMPMGDMGDVFSFGVGPMVSYEKEAGDMGLLGLSASYTILFPKEDFISGGSVIPLQASYKHFFSDVREGFYAGAMFGYGILTVKTEDIDLGPLGTIEGSSASNSGLALAPLVGYFLNERLDVGLRYQLVMISADGDATVESGEETSTNSYLGIRAGYNF